MVLPDYVCQFSAMRVKLTLIEGDGAERASYIEGPIESFGSIVRTNLERLLDSSEFVTILVRYEGKSMQLCCGCVTNEGVSAP